MERILDAASEIVIEGGIEALTTRSIADVAGMPVASIYQYFSDKDAILLAICERDMAEMDEQVAGDLGALTTISVRSIVETAMRAFVKVYRRRPAFMQIWMRGRTNAAVYEYGRRHNQRTAQTLLRYCLDAGLFEASSLDDRQWLTVAELAVETGDTAFQLAYANNRRGDSFVVDQAIELVTGYLERFASEAGLEGVAAP